MEHFDEYGPPAPLEEQIERLAHADTQAQSSDEPDTRVIRALHAYYRSDKGDQRSVDHAWLRLTEITDTAGAHTQSQNFYPDRRARIKPAHTLIKAVHAPGKKTLWQRFSVAAALIIAILLVGSTAGIFYSIQQSRSKSGHEPTIGKTVTASAKLGTNLGNFSLGMSLDDVLPTAGSNAGIWKSSDTTAIVTSDGLAISLSRDSLKAPSAPLVVDLISTQPRPFSTKHWPFSTQPWPSFKGSTAEGFQLGQSLSTFTKLYKQFSIKHTPKAVIVSDSSGTTLEAIFDAKGHALALTLANTTTNP